MSLFSGNRNTFARAIAVGSLTLITGGMLVACGSDDSTVTSTPTTTSAAASSSAASSSASASATTTASAAPTSPGAAATAPPEQPQSIEGFPGPTEVEVNPQAQAFLDGLKAKGVTPEGDGSIAINTANYICAANVQGTSDEEILALVTAVVGSAATDGTAITSEQATANAQIYIDVANATFCK
ncbi:MULTISPECIES: DUF732 domain-containing protein [Rhodococcus]|jgi:hypothetical protein|uniref:Uncharacterized protein n=1 Tax=Nocardia globerula TaxID=1818 RepID=A0A652YP63_NOCGL|nr:MULTISPECIES: DUF732 domain-containing protein [Rhodococcus]NMD62853.1 DUF732 domain-containing protein [Nocardia globerula]MCE4266132.1 DUF732 domain-containing protein [Rhodococcus globerulus]MDV8065755.1 DUF732 domain-containing protein [Rhodococcus sp. IEGM 1366]PVX68309.1 hypothetical protein C8E04_5693 [Rhodococcus globerulus]QXW00796.1 DUF732 domain-containing protein [Rhodococcus globerulus]